MGKYYGVGVAKPGKGSNVGTTTGVVGVTAGVGVATGGVVKTPILCPD